MKWILLLSLFITTAKADYVRDAADYYQLDYKKLKNRVEKKSGIIRNKRVIIYPWTVHKYNKSFQFKTKQELIKYVLANKNTKGLAIGVLPIEVKGLTTAEIVHLSNPINSLMTKLLIEKNKDIKAINTPGDIKRIISLVADKHKISARLITAVIKQESNFNPTVVSSAGAVGLMQIMPATGKDLGLESHELTNPYKNVEAGTRYLKEQLSRFKRLDYALAAYNAGPNAVKKYGGIPPYKETKNYVSRILKNLGARNG